MTENQKKEFISTWMELMVQFHHHDHIADESDADTVVEQFHTMQAEQYRNQMIGMQKCLNIIGYKISVVDGFPTITKKE